MFEGLVDGPDDRSHDGVEVGGEKVCKKVWGVGVEGGVEEGVEGSVYESGEEGVEEGVYVRCRRRCVRRCVDKAIHEVRFEIVHECRGRGGRWGDVLYRTVTSPNASIPAVTLDTVYSSNLMSSAPSVCLRIACCEGEVRG